MNPLSLSTIFLSVLLLGAFTPSSHALSRRNRRRSRIEASQRWLMEQQLLAFSPSVKRHRDLQFVIDYVPGADPDFVCSEFLKNLNGTSYECACDIADDGSVSMKCLETEETCNQGGSICFLQTINLELTRNDAQPVGNAIKTLESCTDYVTNLDNFTGPNTATKFANYSTITPCVKVVPVAPNDFSSLTSCEATINGDPCYKCEICEGGMAITLDCCNTNPNGEPLKVTCAAVGGGGVFAPFFDTYTEDNMEQCASGAVVATGAPRWLVLGVIMMMTSSLVVALF